MGSCHSLAVAQETPFFFPHGPFTGTISKLTLLYKVKGISSDPAGAVTSVLPPTETAGAENSLEI